MMSRLTTGVQFVIERLVLQNVWVLRSEVCAVRVCLEIHVLARTYFAHKFERPARVIHQ